MAVLDKLVPGDYTALLDLKIRTQMDTKSTTNQVGTYFKGSPFVVFEVYPEDKDGIVWGRVSSNTGAGRQRFVGLRVVNQEKAHLEVPLEDNSVELVSDERLAEAIEGNTKAIERLTEAVLRLADK